MRRLLILSLMVGCLYNPAAAQDAVSPADRSEIQSVIAGQIDAFRHDDGAGAFGYAAPNIKSRFGTPENFLGMVREGYQPVYHPRSYSFGALAPQDGVLVQRVELIGPDGDAATALYAMEQEPDGTWRIAGCMLLHGQQLSS
jgi:hypothetical protein